MAADEVRQLLELPFSTVALLGAGYLGYRLAYIGRDAAHKASDTVFLSLVYAAIAKGVGVLFAPIAEPTLQALAGLAGALVVAGTWRRRGQEATFATLRRWGVLDHDGFASAWDSALGRRLPPPTRLVVRLKSGKRLMCENLADFEAAPLGPCLLGPDGSVGLYVTDVMEGPGGEWDERKPFDQGATELGYAMTFIMASEVAEIEISRVP